MKNDKIDKLKDEIDNLPEEDRLLLYEELSVEVIEDHGYIPIEDQIAYQKEKNNENLRFLDHILASKEAKCQKKT